MLKIGEFSKLSRVSVRMLRHYDDIGLLTPAYIDRFTDYRYYSESQLPTVCRIILQVGIHGNRHVTAVLCRHKSRQQRILMAPVSGQIHP